MKKACVAAMLKGTLFALAASSVSLAQNADSNSANSGGLEEIIVTAQHYSESVQKAPLAVTAITGAQIAAQGTFNATDLSGLVPNFVAAQNGPGSTVAIRGIVSTAQTLTGDTEVSYSLDGVNLIQKIGAFQGMYDVNRVEVLRGPQGTLYGANANAGAINVITNKPDLTNASTYGSLALGNYDSISATGAFNMPITDTFGVRVAVDHEYHTGYIKLNTNVNNFQDEDFTGGRIHALWKPSSNFSALFTYEASHNGGAGAGGAGSGGPLGRYIQETGASDFEYSAMPGPQSQDWRVRSATLTLDWSLPFVDIAYIGNSRSQNWVQSDPETIYGPNASYCQDTVNPSQCFNPIITHDNDRQESHELRFSHRSGPAQWLLGLYHNRDRVDFDLQFDPAPFDKNQWAKLFSVYSETADAAYGQLTWDLTKRFSVVGGLRYQRDVKDMPNGGFLAAPVGDIYGNVCNNCTLLAPFSGHGSWSKVQWHGGANFHLTPDSLLFASVATGYESGGFSQGATEPFNPIYGPENLTNYEIGWKSQFLDHRAQLNLDAFLMRYTGYQVTSSIIDANGNYLTVVLNAGTAEIKGVELESTFLVTPVDKLTFDATALDAKFTKFYLPLGDGYVTDPSGIGPTDYTNNDLPNAPHVTARLGYEHTFNLSSDNSLIAHLDASYSAKYWLDYHNYDAVQQDSYSRSNAWLTWEHRKEKATFRGQLYVRNIEGKAILAGGQADANAPNHDFNDYGKNGYYLPPRTFGVRLEVSL